MLETGLIVFLSGIAAWMYFTTPRIREVVFGYALLMAVIGGILALITGQGPSSHYGP